MSRKKKYNKVKQFNQRQNNVTDDLGLENIDIKLSGFKVRVANMDFFFNTSESNIEKFLELSENPDAYLDRLQEIESQHNFNPEEPTMEDFKDSVTAQKQALTIVYDLMLGVGAFERLYSKYPDILALSKIMAKVIETVDKGLNLWAEREQEIQKQATAQAFIEKNKKRGN